MAFLLWGIFPIRLHSPPDPKVGEQGTPNDIHSSCTIAFLQHCTQDNLAGLEKSLQGKEGGDREGGKEEEAIGS